ncbi:DUF2939 domain-containing protein [Sphingomonas panacisoli]|uniref:DUF2939 domain-containing protein n=1 Tax=Sphingomonas panacisoli TaxID=1813879 RepID=A0A5B8LFH8_9SPHN|nr:DUF2939 domain-containing protein [Sphingomonas panacisoli]QDZ07008.1 DUF2939 domain-containing protein [Sphingomonas panacisoli]
MKGWQVGSLGAVAFAGFCGWYITSPWVTLYGIQVAAERHDVDAMIGYVDFDALRADLKDQLHAASARQPRRESSLPPGWSVPDRAATQVEAMDRQIDALVTPETARAMLGRTGASAPGFSGSVGDPGALARDVVVDRETLGRFVARGRNASPGIGLVFTAHGLGWRLSGIRLSPEMTERGTRSLFGH